MAVNLLSKIPGAGLLCSSTGSRMHRAMTTAIAAASSESRALLRRCASPAVPPCARAYSASRSASAKPSSRRIFSLTSLRGRTSFACACSIFLMSFMPCPPFPSICAAFSAPRCSSRSPCRRAFAASPPLPAAYSPPPGTASISRTLPPSGSSPPHRR